MIFIGPPQAGPCSLTGYRYPVATPAVLRPHKATVPGGIGRHRRLAVIVNADGIFLALFLGFRKSHKDRIVLSGVRQLLLVQDDAINLHILEQIKLQALKIGHGRVGDVHKTPDALFTGVDP